MSDKLDEWETGDTAARWMPEHRSPYSRQTEVWQVTYYRGHYYQRCITRKSGATYAGMNFTLRGTYVHQPIRTWQRGTGVFPYLWCGEQVAQFQTFTYDDERPGRAA